MADVTEQFRKYQISASEALRAGSMSDISTEERIAYFEEAVGWARKAFFEAKQNVYARVLAFDQYQCGMGLALLAQNDYNSIVVSDLPPGDAIGRD